ncbi:hypothetical protein BO71DRAFT_445834 [Aspergillus ellipticus CBS 707.79]|uniref:GPI-anchored cell surface glycoprotein n=1 Tax=Aspergillus ellipticus CBS 707.79 TaxID=1448320 RepID=A0A319CQC3_9EURO|nr:hypothetical protein BO71DRAFT_445834 [Aspergillus ellipticus CBS 707.79]
MGVNNKPVLGRASVARDLGSPAALPLDSPRETRRSSSRASLASRKTTREPEAHPSTQSHSSHSSHSSYSLPPTPLTATFEESLPSAKRRKTQRPVAQDEKTPQSKGSAETPNQKGSGGSSQPSNGVSKKRDRNRKSTLTNGDSATPSSSNPKPKDQSQSTLLNFLSRSQDRRKSAAAAPTVAATATNTEEESNSDKPSTMGTSVSNNRTARKSMPAKLNGVESSDNASVAPTSAPVASTPQSRKDRNLKGAEQTSAKATKTPARVKAEPKSSASSAVKPAKAQGNGASKPSTPNTTTRSRRPERKSAMATASHNNTGSQPAQSTPVSGPSASTRKPASQVATRTSTRPQRSAKKSAMNGKSLESPFGREVADSIESTPALDDKTREFISTTGFDVGTPGLERDSYGDGDSYFEYNPDMYRNNFGLDGNLDGPGSPTTSFSTTTSAAARTSGRTRKPTIKAMESIESERRFRRTRASSVKAESTKEADGAAGKARDTPQSQPQPGDLSTNGHASQPELAALGSQLFGLAASAVDPGFAPVADAEAWLEELRQEFEKKKDEKKNEEVGTSRGEPDPEAEAEAEAEADSGAGDSKKVNSFGEELVPVEPEYEWYRPNNTYGDQLLPQPPLRLKSRDQLEKDRIFGYPPRMGERNVPRETNLPFLYENVDEVRATIKAREEAKKRGIHFDPWMASVEILALISQFDEDPVNVEASEPTETKEPPTRKRRRGEATETTQVSKRRRKEPTPEQPKTLRIKLTLNRNAAAKKRPHSQIEELPDDTDEQEDGPSSSKILKLSGLPRDRAAKSNLPPSTPSSELKRESVDEASGASEAGPADQAMGETPGGRPRRRAAAALIAEFQNHAEARARRASARKKGTADKADDPGDGLTH